MIELPLILIGGLLGSSHCIGMCGGFAILIGMAAPDVGRNLLRQSAYSFGRIFTYAFLGAVSGFVGSRFESMPFPLISAQALLALIAGMLLIGQGLTTAGLLPRRVIGTTESPCLFGSFVAPMLRTRQLANVFVAGLLTGFLPCGLVYAYLALSATTGSVWHGALAMSFFGAGTVPAMIGTGAGTSLMSVTARKRILHVAAWCVLATGVLTIGRGIASLSIADEGQQPACPMCGQQSIRPTSTTVQ